MGYHLSSCHSLQFLERGRETTVIWGFFDGPQIEAEAVFVQDLSLFRVDGNELTKTR